MIISIASQDIQVCVIAMMEMESAKTLREKLASKTVVFIRQRDLKTSGLWTLVSTLATETKHAQKTWPLDLLP